jgi:hypothetical protein
MFRKNEDVDTVGMERQGMPAPEAVREQLDGVVFDPVYSGRMIHRSRYDFREMRKLRKGPSWKAVVAMEIFENKTEDDRSGMR